jgi:hypothetical protein
VSHVRGLGYQDDPRYEVRDDAAYEAARQRTPRGLMADVIDDGASSMRRA